MAPFKAAVLALGTATAFNPSTPLRSHRTARRAADVPESAPAEEGTEYAWAEAAVAPGPDATATKIAAGATAATAAGTASLLASAAGTACAGGACAVGASAAATAATTGASAGILGGLGAQLAAALGTLGLSAGVAFAGGDELAAMARDGIGLQAAFASPQPVVLEFYAADCAHCRESSKRLHDVERAHPEVAWVMVDTRDEGNRVLWEKLGVDDIPHFAFLDAGKELKRTEIGPISTDQALAGIRSVVIPGM
jgi:thiol-disulfide isomerase/thioredoxin